MTKQKRYLITTEDEATWKFDQPVIFLGEWCRSHNRKHLWQSMDAIVSKPYGLGADKKDADHKEIIDLEKKLFPELYEILNQHFHLTHSKRFWQIFLGPWFRANLQLLLNRINTLKQCLQSEEISGTLLYHSDYSALATPNLKSLYDFFFENKKWNNVLNGRILEILHNNKITLDYIEKHSTRYIYQNTKHEISKKNRSFKSKLKKIIYRVYKKTAGAFVRNSDAFLISTYFPTKELIKIELSLKQFPQIWTKSDLKIDLTPNQSLRKNLTKKFIKKSTNDLENIVRVLSFELLPVCYLEGFEELKKIVHQQPWPKSPKLIFTSNNFGTDEIFKLYTSIKTETGSKYYVGQHGNNYFTRRYHFPKIEQQTPDKFFTWGWEILPKYVPAYIFKTVGKSSTYNRMGGLLLIEKSQEQRVETWDTYSEYLNYFEDQKKFYNRLENKPKKNLIVRLSSSKVSKKLEENSRWLDFNNSIKIDNGSIAIRHLIAESRLVVHSYDSTGLLETLAQNIPTLAFWQDGLDHLREEVRPDYQKLIDAGIIHLSAQSVANKVNEIWENVDSWWLQKNVQEAKKQFCNIYSKNCKNPINTMVSLLVKKEI